MQSCLTPNWKGKRKNYLLQSQALEGYWQRSLTAEQLQAEMERMAKHTNQPDVLREIFAALGNEPLCPLPDPRDSHTAVWTGSEMIV